MAEIKPKWPSSGKRDKKAGTNKDNINENKGDFQQETFQCGQTTADDPDATHEQSTQCGKRIKDTHSAESCKQAALSKTLHNIHKPDDLSKTYVLNRNKEEQYEDTTQDLESKTSKCIQTLIKDRDYYKAKCHEFNKHIEELSAKNNALRESEKKKEHHLKEDRIPIDSLERNNEALRQEKSKLQSDKKELPDKNKHLNDEIRNLQSEKDQLQNEKEKYKSNYRDLDKDYKDLLDRNKHLNDEIRNLQSEKDQLQNEKEKYKSNYRDLDKDYKDLLDRNKHLNDEIRNLQSEKDQLQNEKEKYKSNYRDLDKDYKDLLDRFGRVASSKLTKDNPAVGNLSDPYRATNLADKYGKLYEETWTQTYRKMTKPKVKKDKEIVQFLLNILKEAFEFCQEMKKEQHETVKRDLFYPKWLAASPEKQVPIGAHKTLNEEQTDALQDVQKLVAIDAIEWVRQAFNDVQKENDKHEPMYEPYYKKCIEFSWPAVLHRPPIVMVTNIQPGDDINDSMYNMRSTGDEVESLVWPPLIMGDHILHKGVIEGRRTLSNKQASSDL